MNAHRRHIVLLITTTLACLSCITLPETDYESAASRVVELLNKGAIDTLVKHTRIPFVLDKEIIMLEADAHLFWSTVAENGLTIEVKGVTLHRSDATAFYSLFGDTMDMNVFYKNLPGNTQFVSLNTSLGKATLILGEIRGGNSRNLRIQRF